MELQDKVSKAIRLLQSTCKDKEVELSYSGGKDSDVILELAKMAGINYRAIHKCTTIDPPGTLAHVIRVGGVEIVHAKKTFFKLVEEKGLPNMYMRFCCKELKEYKILDTAILGIRKAESAKRNKLYKEPVVCRFYGNKQNRVEQIYPILEWTNKDITDFISLYKVKLHPYYYTQDGKLDTTRRLGCMLCPFSKGRGLAYYKAYPKLVRLTLRALRKYRDEHPQSKANKQFRNEYEQFVFHLFYQSLDSFYLDVRKDMFGNEVDCKKFLEGCFGIPL